MRKFSLFLALVLMLGLAAAQPVDQQMNKSEINETTLEKGLDKAFNNAEKIENNLTEINQGIQENVPGPIRTIVLGSDVNVRVGEAVLGVKTNKSGITDLESDGLENPEMNITTDGDTILNITNSENPVENFREAFHGEGIKVETNSVKTTVTVGAVRIVSGAYGLVSGLV